MNTTSTPVPVHPEDTPFAGYPFFIEDEASRDLWDDLTPERQARYLRAVPYIQEGYPDEKLSVGMIGTILAFGG